MKPVLIVAYYYPPSGGAGVQRTLKFSRYLPELGWRPHLLVPRDPDYPVRDPSLVREIPEEAVIHRTRIFEPYGLYRRLTGRRGTRGNSLDVATLSRDAAENRRLSERISEWVRATFFIPDARIGWLPFAVRAGRRVCREVRPRLIYSTAPPYTAHLIGLRLHRETGIPWVADFRDSWVDWLSAAKRTGIPRRLDLAMEGAVLRNASACVAVTHGVKDDLMSRHPDIQKPVWHIIPNGFDPIDLESAQADRDGVTEEQLLLTYTGTLYGPRNPETLVRALESLADEGHDCGREIRVRLVGRVAESIRRDVARSRVSESFIFTDYADHTRAIALTKGSDAALLIIDDAPQSAGILTGKLFEYLGLRKPIVAIAPPGEAKNLLNALGNEWVAHPGDVSGMKCVLITLWDAWRRGELRGPEPEAVARFSRRRQTETLAELFEMITTERRRG